MADTRRRHAGFALAGILVVALASRAAAQQEAVVEQLASVLAAEDARHFQPALFGSAVVSPDSLVRRLAALDGLARVIRIGSFSKTLSASIRCGYIAARPDWVEALVDLQVATNFGGPSPAAAELVLATLNDGNYRKHLDGLRRRLARLRRETAARLESLGLRPWLMPRGGFYLWCSLPDGRDAADVARAALRENVVLAPGNVFSASRSASGFLRFNAAQMGDPRIFDVLKRAIGIHGVVDALLVAACNSRFLHHDLAVFNASALERDFVRDPGSDKRDANECERNHNRADR